MRATSEFELPEELRPVLRRAILLEWITIGYLVTVVVAMGLVMGSSQAMRTAWVEDLLSFIPPIAFLVAQRVRRRPADERFPYGYHRAVTIAYLISSLVLLLFGGILTFEGARDLISAHRPTIGNYLLDGRVVWQGWVMLAVLVWAVVPVIVLGHLKKPLASRLHDKALYADAEMNRADWLSGLAAGLGVLGVGMGWWWADATGALVISLDILRDGWGNLRAAIGDLMDREPQTYDHSGEDELPERTERAIRSLPWVTDVQVRMREHGHVFFGEAFVAAKDQGDCVGRTREIERVVASLDWRLHELVVSWIEPEEPAEAERSRESR